MILHSFLKLVLRVLEAVLREIRVDAQKISFVPLSRLDSAPPASYIIGRLVEGSPGTLAIEDSERKVPVYMNAPSPYALDALILVTEWRYIRGCRECGGTGAEEAAYVEIRDWTLLHPMDDLPRLSASELHSLYQPIYTVDQLVSASISSSSHVHVVGTITSLSPVISLPNSPPFFFVCVSSQRLSTRLIFTGLSVRWWPFLRPCESYLFTNLRRSVLFKGKPLETTLLATRDPNRSDFRSGTIAVPMQVPSAAGVGENNLFALSSPRAEECFHEKYEELVTYTGKITEYLQHGVYRLDGRILLYLSHYDIPGKARRSVDTSHLAKITYLTSIGEGSAGGD